MDKITLSYIAGFMDGEGCITLNRTYRKDARNKKAYFRDEYLGAVQIGMADIPIQREILKMLKEHYGGYYAEFAPRPSAGKNSKPTIFWRILSQKAARFCEDILPYLRVKKRQAEIVIEMAKSTRSNRGKKKLPDQKVLLLRKRLLEEVRILNKRGL